MNRRCGKENGAFVSRRFDLPIQFALQNHARPKMNALRSLGHHFRESASRIGKSANRVSIHLGRKRLLRKRRIPVVRTQFFYHMRARTRWISANAGSSHPPRPQVIANASTAAFQFLSTRWAAGLINHLRIIDVDFLPIPRPRFLHNLGEAASRRTANRRLDRRPVQTRSTPQPAAPAAVRNLPHQFQPKSSCAAVYRPPPNFNPETCRSQQA